MRFKYRLYVALLAASATVVANCNTDVPTGSCTITVPNMTPACINLLTRAACQERAQSNGGTAQWAEEATCPTPQEINQSRGGYTISYPEVTNPR